MAMYYGNDSMLDRLRSLIEPQKPTYTQPQQPVYQPQIQPQVQPQIQPLLPNILPQEPMPYKPPEPQIQPPSQPVVQPRVQEGQQPGSERPAKPGDLNPQQPFIPPNPFVPVIQRPVPNDVNGPTNADQQRSISEKLLEQLLSFIGSPSRYNNDIVGKQFDAQRGRLQQGFDVQRQQTMEDAARRGLFYSTEPTGRLGDIAGQQARAESDLMTNLTTDQARTYGEDMQRAISTILGFGNQQFGQQMATAQFNMLQDEAMRNFLLQVLGGTQ